MSEETHSSQEGMPFSAFVISLSTMALAALGECDEPGLENLPKDPLIARNNIDILLMLREKTRGNLTMEESQLLTSIIYDLQMRYVKATT